MPTSDRDDPLQGLSPDELLALARQMLAEEPRLAQLLPKRKRSTRSKVDPEVATRKRVRDIFRHAGFVGWRNERVRARRAGGDRRRGPARLDGWQDGARWRSS